MDLSHCPFTMAASIGPLEQYLATFDSYREFIKMDVEAYLADLKETNITEDGMMTGQLVEVDIPPAGQHGAF